MKTASLFLERCPGSSQDSKARVGSSSTPHPLLPPLYFTFFFYPLAFSSILCLPLPSNQLQGLMDFSRSRLKYETYIYKIYWANS